MAKKGNRIILALQCAECGAKNYTSKKNKLNTQEKVNLSKYCPKCRKHQKHKEVKPK